MLQSGSDKLKNRNVLALVSCLSTNPSFLLLIAQQFMSTRQFFSLDLGRLGPFLILKNNGNLCRVPLVTSTREECAGPPLGPKESMEELNMSRALGQRCLIAVAGPLSPRELTLLLQWSCTVLLCSYFHKMFVILQEHKQILFVLYCIQRSEIMTGAQLCQVIYSGVFCPVQTQGYK